MADVKISDMAAAATLDGTEQVELNQSGNTVRTTTADIRNAGVKVYRALLTQTGTNAPVATVLENTLGGVPVWSYVSAGIYTLTLIGSFPQEKTFILMRGFVGDDPANEFSTAFAYSISANEIRLKTCFFETTGAVGSLANDLLSDTPIEILVYP